MGLPGTKPVEDRSQVRRRNAPTEGTEWREVDDVPFVGRALPIRGEESSTAATRPIGVFAERWPQRTLDWWAAVSKMPHCALWDEAEWEVAYDVAEAHARFIEGWQGCASGAELRIKQKALGIGYDARRDLRIRYVKPKARPADGEPEELPAGVTRLDDFRDL